MIEQSIKEVAEAMQENPTHWAEIYLQQKKQLDEAIEIVQAMMDKNETH